MTPSTVSTGQAWLTTGTISRLQQSISGYTLTPTDAIAMLQLCSYETDALGYSKFCGLFTEEDFNNYECEPKP
jgi:hypothetical protein